MHSQSAIRVKYPEIERYLAAYYGHPTMPEKSVPWDELDNFDMTKGFKNFPVLSEDSYKNQFGARAGVAGLKTNCLYYTDCGGPFFARFSLLRKSKKKGH